MIDKIQKLCDEHNVKLLYACLYGSQLYGTSNENSDVDIKGIILPSKKSCFLYNKINSITISTGKDNDKNSKDDIDIQLWSVQYWTELVYKGDTNALDLLYSITHKNCIIYKDDRMDIFFDNYRKMFDPTRVKAFIGYAISQAKRYGLRGSRYGIIKEVRDRIKKLMKGKLVADENTKYEKLGPYIDSIIEYSGHENFCFKKEIQNGDQLIESIVICNKIYLGNIALLEAFERLDVEYKKYGDRAKLALKNEGLDFKALSHAVRSIIQMKHLLEKQFIEFPFKGKDKEILLAIKNGEMKWVDIEKIIVEGIEEIEEKQKGVELNYKYNHKFVSDNILKLYY